MIEVHSQFRVSTDEYKETSAGKWQQFLIPVPVLERERLKPDDDVFVDFDNKRCTHILDPTWSNIECYKLHRMCLLRIYCKALADGVESLGDMQAALDEMFDIIDYILFQHTTLNFVSNNKNLGKYKTLSPSRRTDLIYSAIANVEDRCQTLSMLLWSIASLGDWFYQNLHDLRKEKLKQAKQAQIEANIETRRCSMIKALARKTARNVLENVMVSVETHRRQDAIDIVARKLGSYIATRIAIRREKARKLKEVIAMNEANAKRVLRVIAQR